MNSVILSRLIQPSSFAGYGLIYQGVTNLVAHGAASADGWALIFSGVLAVLKGEAVTPIK